MGCGASSVAPVIPKADETGAIVSARVASDEEAPVAVNKKTEKANSKAPALITDYHLTLSCLYIEDSFDGRDYDSDTHIRVPLYNYLRRSFPEFDVSLDFVPLKVPEFQITLNRLNGVSMDVDLYVGDSPLNIETFDKAFVYEIGHEMRRLALETADNYIPPISASALHRLFTQVIACTLLEDYTLEESQRAQPPLPSNAVEAKAVGNELPPTKKARLLAFFDEAGFRMRGKGVDTLSAVHKALDKAEEHVRVYVEPRAHDIEEFEAYGEDAAPVRDVLALSSLTYPVYPSKFIPFPESRRSEYNERAPLQAYLASAPESKTYASGIETDSAGAMWTTLQHLHPHTSYDEPVCDEVEGTFTTPEPMDITVDVSSKDGFDIFQHLGVRPTLVRAQRRVPVTPDSMSATPDVVCIVPQYRANAADQQALHFMFILCVASVFNVPSLEMNLYGNSRMSYCVEELFYGITQQKPRLTNDIASKLLEHKIVQGRGCQGVLKDLMAQFQQHGFSAESFHGWWKQVVEGADIRTWEDAHFEQLGLTKMQASKVLTAAWSISAVRFCKWLFSQLDGNKSGVLEQSDLASMVERIALERGTTTLDAIQTFATLHENYAYPTGRLLHLDENNNASFESWLYFAAVTCQNRPANLLNFAHSVLSCFTLPEYTRGKQATVYRDRRERAICVFYLISKGAFVPNRTCVQFVSSYIDQTPPDTAFESNLVCVGKEDYITLDQVPTQVANPQRLEAATRAKKRPLEDSDLVNGKLKIRLADWLNYFKNAGLFEKHPEEAKRLLVDKFWNQIARGFGV